MAERRNHKGLTRAIRLLGSQAELARQLGITPVAVSSWVNGYWPMSPHHAIAIEKATGGAVSRGELRPDLWEPTKPS